MAKVIHYISEEFNSSFIVAVSYCGRNWQEIDDHSSSIKYVTCKKCLKKIK